MNRVLLVSISLAAVSLPGCEQSPPGRTSTQPSASASTQKRTGEVDRLRAIPYAGVVEQEDEDGASGVVVDHRDSVAPGYTLYIVNKLCLADLIDESGKVFRTWRADGSLHWYQADLQTNGDLLVVGCDLSQDGTLEVSDERRYLIRFSWDGRVLWKRYLTAHHDVETTPGGNLLTLTILRRRAPELHETVELRDEALTLLEPGGADLEVLSLYDLLRARPDMFPLQPVKPSRLGSRMELDLIHANSVEWMSRPDLVARDPIFGPDNILACCRHQDRIFVVNWRTRELIWAWGNNEISGPHDAQCLPNGNFLLFDNGIERKWSRVIELDPLKRAIVWEFKAPTPTDFFTLTKGSCQRLANSNTLITNSDSGEVFEVTPAGGVVWRFLCPHRGDGDKRATIARARRYEPGFIEPLLRP